MTSCTGQDVEHYYNYYHVFKKIVFDCLYMHEFYPKIFSRCCINKSNFVANEKGWNVETKDFNCKGNNTA